MSELFTYTIQDAEAEAVNTGKALFVYISDSVPDQDFEDKYLSDKNLANRISSSTVLLRLQKGTRDFDMFAQLFGEVITPSFFILKGGKKIDVITRDVSASSFTNKMEKLMSTGTITGETELSKETPVVQPVSVDHKKMETDALEEKRKEQMHLRELLKADRKEQMSQAAYEKARIALISALKTEVEEAKVDPSKCLLHIKLFDGTSLEHEFNRIETLADVRAWLDKESGHEVIPNSHGLMSSLAPLLQPPIKAYSFLGAVFGQSATGVVDENKLLDDFGLAPRSTIFLKPIYEDIATSPKTHEAGLVKSMGKSLTKLTNALYSFFDYGMMGNGDVLAVSEEDMMENMPMLPGTHIIPLSPIMSDVEDEESLSEEMNKDDKFQPNRVATPVDTLAKSITRVETVHDKEQGWSNTAREG